jgi:hypothetical protein
MKRVLPLVLLIACEREEPFEDWYPADITSPAGTQFPGKVTPLPKDLRGIPPSHRRFINHAYSLVIKAVHHRLAIYHNLGMQHPPQMVLDAYLKATRDLQQKLREEPAPQGLETFKTTLLEALDLQMEFFIKATASRQLGQSFEQWIQIPEGRSAGAKLQAAYGIMASTYPNWSPEVQDSIYHHLCALDIF